MTTNNQIDLNVTPRGTGKGLSRGLRKNKQVPAIVYGPNLKNTNISVYIVDAQKYSKYEYENAVFNLQSEDSKLNGQSALIKEVIFHPVTHMPVHIDFYAPDMKQTVKVNVEINFEGKAAGLADGGLFSAIKRDVEVECLPNEIPDSITVDVSELQLNGSLHVSDIPVPTGVKMISSETETIATCAIVEEEKPAEETSAAVEGAEVGDKPAES